MAPEKPLDTEQQEIQTTVFLATSFIETISWQQDVH